MPWRRGLTVRTSPQRYSSNYAKYLRLGGTLNVRELVAGFTAGYENQYDMARFFFFCLTFDQIIKEGLQGDLAELGTYKGHTATLLAAIARKLGRTAYVLDTFIGFDKSDVKGIDSGTDVKMFSDTSLEAVRALVGEDNVRYIKGYFPETASQLPAAGEYCLVHIDCDLYAPIRSALEYFYPRVVPGGFLIVHDYSSLAWSGADKAVDEFFADKPEAPVALPDSAGSVVVRKARTNHGGEGWLLRKRAALLSPNWVSAANGGVRDLLGEGWGAPENWGVWGVGEVHDLHIVRPRSLQGDVMFEADVQAALAGPRTSQQVEVTAADQTLAVWEFTHKYNKGIRGVRVPVADLARHDGEYLSIVLQFRPQQIESPRDLSPEYTDDRPLGMAISRIRCYPAQGRDAWRPASP